jgi:hypothetical protein
MSFDIYLVSSLLSLACNWKEELELWWELILSVESI